MDAFASIITLVLCVSAPLFFGATVFLAVTLYKQRAKHQSLLADERNLHEKQKGSLSGEKEVLLTEIQRLENNIEVLSKNAIADFCLRWCKEIDSAYYSSEVEVEIKFIYPFMRFLGYGISDLKTRISIEVPVGRQKIGGVADWVVYNHQYGKPFLVIEAKEPNQQLNKQVQEQARSYAFALNAPYYMLTNGREVAVFERRIDDDAKILHLGVKDLAHRWQQIEQAIGKRQLTPQ